MIPFDRELSRCKWPDGGCGRKILWTITASAERQRLDHVPSDRGSIAAYRSSPRTWSSRSLLKAGAPALGTHEHRYEPHEDTCPKRKAQRAAAGRVEIPGLLPGAAVLDLDAARRRRRSR